MESLTWKDLFRGQAYDKEEFSNFSDKIKTQLLEKFTSFLAPIIELMIVKEFSQVSYEV